MEKQIIYLILAMAGMFSNPVFSGGGAGPGPGLGKPVIQSYTHILPAGDRGTLEMEQGEEVELKCYSVSPRSIGYNSNLVWRYGQEELHPMEKGTYLPNAKWKTTSWCKIKPQQDLYVVCSVNSEDFPELKNSTTLHIKVVNTSETVDSGLWLVILAILSTLIILTIGFIYRKNNNNGAHTEAETAPLEKREDSTANDMENQCSVRCVTAKRRRGYKFATAG